jgi:hypothetical protein
MWQLHSRVRLVNFSYSAIKTISLVCTLYRRDSCSTHIIQQSQQTSSSKMAASDMAQYDLTTKLVANLDRHLTIPLLEHLADTELFPSSQIAKAQYVASQQK